MSENLDVYTDGGSRGNPGKAASAFVIYKGGVEIYKDSLYLGKATNNHAEYIGVLLAIKWIIDNQENLSEIKSIKFFLDSELVTNQLKGLYKIKNENLISLAGMARNNLKKIDIPFSFISVPRSKNTVADRLVNECLDAQV